MIRLGIAGYGNIGRGVETAVSCGQNPDIELRALFTRRDPETLRTASSVPVYPLEDAEKYKDEIDVLIICGGSATDLPVQGPALARIFNTVDSFDTHARIPQYFADVDRAARESGHISVISSGWDPGMFSINRVYSEAILPNGSTYTFWGKGVSQGHSDAIRRIPGVKNAIQYTVPIDSAIEAARSGSAPSLSTRDKHTRVCYVVAEDNADRAAIESAIVNMPNYFAEYDTYVHFISEDELKRSHSEMPHGGFVIRSGETGGGKKHIVEYSLKLDSNPEFTSSVLVAVARAAYRLAARGETGARTMLDIPPVLLSQKTPEELRAALL